ncbi:MAG: lysophospholipid acyltransferase family protein [Dermabacter sp.]|nr:lysophospholipid acyltransferase family protein [Dermabacter sp.]
MFYESVRNLVRPFIKAWWRPEVVGLENIPSTGPVILASNHLANVDSFLVPVVTPRKVRYIIKADYWQQKGLKARVAQKFFESIGSVPVERGTLKAAQGSLDAALGVLNDGGVFGIYPEGTRSKNGKLGKGRTGVAWLEEHSDAPVIPVGLRGTNALFVRGKLLPRPKAAKLRVAFGPPVDFTGIDRSLPENQRRRLVTERVMDAIQELSGQDRAAQRPVDLQEPGADATAATDEGAVA